VQTPDARANSFGHYLITQKRPYGVPNSLEGPERPKHVCDMQFYQLAKGARFEFRGKQFQKIAMSMAEDAERNGNIFQGETEIIPIGEPLLLADEQAAEWKPSATHWTAFMSPAPGQSPSR
jgi:hypothetical protein